MKPFTTLVLCAGVVAALPAALYLADWAYASGQAPMSRNLTLADWLHEMRRFEQLESDRAVINSSTVEKVKIIADLIAGRLSLCGAADALRQECENKPPHLREQELRPSGQSIEEYFVRLAFLRADVELTDDPRRDVVLTRLRAELRDYLYAQATAQP
ncbi:MAG TPA: hypothetical protein VH643_34020 [Gemmataceae bacterium]|jgi:hypothetical protein